MISTKDYQKLTSFILNMICIFIIAIFKTFKSYFSIVFPNLSFTFKVWMYFSWISYILHFTHVRKQFANELYLVTNVVFCHFRHEIIFRFGQIRKLCCLLCIISKYFLFFKKKFHATSLQNFSASDLLLIFMFLIL